MKNTLLIALLLTVTAASAESDERAAIKREKQAIEATYAQREQACRRQFVVTPCVDQVRREKNEALNTVRARESALDSAERLERAEAKKRRVAEKASQAQAADEANKAQPAASAAAAKDEPAQKRSSAIPSSHKAASAPSAGERKAREQEKRAEFDARQREIEVHRAEVLKRNADKAARSGKPAKPLPPLPASGAGSTN